MIHLRDTVAFDYDIASTGDRLNGEQVVYTHA